MDEAQTLPGGNVGGQVVRIGDTVRKRWTAATPSVTAYVHALREAGVDAPAPLGRDAEGRQVQEFIPGHLAMAAQPLTHAELRRAGSMVRSIHDASASYVPAADAVWETAIPAPDHELVCHNDLAPWNLVLGERWVFIDWDASAPSTRLWDLAYAAQSFTVNDHRQPPDVAARALAAFVDGYGADPETRELLPAAMGERAEAMWELLHTSSGTGHEPWASMFRNGHGAHWETATRYVKEHRGTWARITAPRSNQARGDGS